MKTNWVLGAAMGALAAMGVAGHAMAGSVAVTVTETLTDDSDFSLADIFLRDMVRERTSTHGGYYAFGDDDSVIESDHFTGNPNNDNFGYYTSDPVIYWHDLSWAVPTPESFVSATLEIWAWGVDGGGGNRDAVQIRDVVNMRLGFLEPDPLDGTGILEFLGENTTTSSFTLSDGSLLDGLFADGRLRLRIRKSHDDNPLFNDEISVFQSRLTATYMAPTPGAALAGLPMLLSMLGLRRRRA